MVEQVTPNISQSQLGANGDHIEGGEGETVLLGQSDHLVVAWPGAGEAVTLEPQPGQPIEFQIDFSSDALEIVRDADGNLIFRGPDGEITLSGGMTLLESDNPPAVFFGETQIEVGDLAGLMGIGSLDDIASAAGAGPQNTGAAFRPHLFGELPPGLEDLGPQPPTALIYRLIEGLFDVSLLRGEDAGPLGQGGGGPEGECDTCCCVEVPELSVVLYGTPEDDLYDGNLDTDTFYGSAGWDLMFGRGASDTVDYSLLDFDGCWGVFVDIGEFFLPFFGWIGEADKGDFGYDLLISLENVVGTDYSDAIYGNSHPNTLDGRAGHDYLNGRGGDDLLIGGEGDDWIDGGDECAIGDTVSYADDPEGYYGGVLIDLQHGYAIDGWNDYDHLENIENAIGSQFSDLILGDYGGNILNGLGGDDEIYGDHGNDTLIGGDGADMMFGEEGDDTVDYSGDPDPDGDGMGVIVDLRPDPEDYDFDSLTSGRADNGIAVDGWGNIDVVGELSGQANRYNDIENVVGSRFDDLISGDYGDNMLAGDFFDVRADGMAVGGYVLPSLEELLALFDEGGEQVLQSEGWSGDFSAPDYIYYGDHDSFTGGNDVIEGEPGDDLITGDVYEFSGNESLQFAQIGDCNDCTDSDYVGGDVYFYAGCDVLYGGNDIINGDFTDPAERRDFEGNDTIAGDVLTFEGNEAVLTEPYDGDWFFGFGLGTGDVFFTGGNDALYGGDDTIHGGFGFYDGNDPLDGRGPGDDTIYGDAEWFRGDEQIGAAEYGGICGDIVFECGNDALYGGNDTIYGGAEYLVVPGNVKTLDTLFGDAGTVDFNELFSASAWCDPSEGWAGGNILVKGGDDSFVGGDDVIYGGGLVDEYGGISPEVGTKIRGNSCEPAILVTGLAALYGDFGGLDMGETAIVSASEPDCGTCEDGAPTLSIVFEGGNDSAIGGNDYLYGGDDVMEAYGGGKVRARGLDLVVGDGEEVDAGEQFIGTPIDDGVVVIDVSGANDSFVGGNDELNGGYDTIWSGSGNVVIGTEQTTADGVKELIGDAVAWNAGETVEVSGAAHVDFSGGNDVFQGGNDLMVAGDIKVHTDSGKVRISDGSLLVGDVQHAGGEGTGDGMSEYVYIAGDSDVPSSVDFSGGNDALYGGDDEMHGSDITVCADDCVTVQIDSGFSRMFGDAYIVDMDEWIQVSKPDAEMNISGGNDTLIGGNDLMWAGDVILNGPGEIITDAPRFTGYAEFEAFGADWFNSHCFDELSDGNGIGYGGAYMVGDVDQVSTDEVIVGGNRAMLDFSGGNDTVIGGNDEMYGSSLHDIMIGDFGAIAAEEYVHAGNNSTITGDGGADTFIGGNDLIDGGDGDDLLFGDWAVLASQSDNDSFTGGNDTLIGGNGSDVLVGGDGQDTMTGGEAGGSGDGATDIFVWTDLGEFGDGDIVTDFEMGSNGFAGDYIDLSEVLSGFGSFDLSFAGDTLSVNIAGEGSFDVVSLQGLSGMGVTIDDLQAQIVTECGAVA